MDIAYYVERQDPDRGTWTRVAEFDADHFQNAVDQFETTTEHVSASVAVRLVSPAVTS